MASRRGRERRSSKHVSDVISCPSSVSCGGNGDDDDGKGGRDAAAPCPCSVSLRVTTLSPESSAAPFCPCLRRAGRNGSPFLRCLARFPPRGTSLLASLASLNDGVRYISKTMCRPLSSLLSHSSSRSAPMLSPTPISSPLPAKCKYHGSIFVPPQARLKVTISHRSASFNFTPPPPTESKRCRLKYQIVKLKAMKKKNGIKKQ